MKVVINTCFGGFSLSEEAHALYSSVKQAKVGYRPNDRSDPLLVGVVEELGQRANGPFASLKVVEIPDGTEWEICEYDGAEWVAEKHRKWE